MVQKLDTPVALTVAGSDSGGGAGIQADLKTFAALGVHGTSVITCVTAQNPRRVSAIQPCSPAIIRQQLEAVFVELRPNAIKTGMLLNAEIIRTVARFLKPHAAGRIPLVVDPVMIATSGARLLQHPALDALTRELLPLATLVTPNLAEAAMLVGKPLKSVEDMRAAARMISQRFGCAALVKGGHLIGSREAVDILNDGENEWLFAGPFVKGRRLHGTGCTYSAAITSHLARGLDLSSAITRAKEYMMAAIANAQRVRGHWVLNHLPKP